MRKNLWSSSSSYLFTLKITLDIISSVDVSKDPDGALADLAINMFKGKPYVPMSLQTFESEVEIMDNTIISLFSIGTT